MCFVCLHGNAKTSIFVFVAGVFYAGEVYAFLCRYYVDSPDGDEDEEEDHEDDGDGTGKVCIIFLACECCLQKRNQNKTNIAESFQKTQIGLRLVLLGGPHRFFFFCCCCIKNPDG